MSWTVRINSPETRENEPLLVDVGVYCDGEAMLARRGRLDVIPTPHDMANVRWYLEDFPNHPYDPAPTLARAAQSRMRQLGASMFTSLRAAASHPLLDRRLGDALAETGIEIEGSSGIPWELMRDPATGRLPAIRAQSMVRLITGRVDAPPARLETPARMLLVVCRPAGARDVRFQSVARPLLSTVANCGGVEIVVLRPATYESLTRTLDEAQATGAPFDLVHFDGHGLIYNGRGCLVFEAESEGQPGVRIPGSSLGDDLASAGVRLAVLNACRSADIGLGEGARPAAFRSLAEELMLAGLSGAVAMQYDVRVDTAARFVAPLYTSLIGGASLSESATLARRALYEAIDNADSDRDRMAIDDWFVPVVYDAGTTAAALPMRGAAGPAIRLRPHEATESDIYDATFRGRDDVLLQLDRALDRTSVVDLCGMAGSGKTTAARQFARWYRATQGITGDVIEIHIGLDVATASDRIAAALGETAATAERRFAEPGLLLVDDVNAPPHQECDRMNEMFSRIASTGTRIVLTSHWAPWLEQAAHIRLDGIADGDLVDILSDRLGATLKTRSLAAWRPVLDLANGNPLALETLIDWSQALPDRDPASLRSLVDDVLAGNGPTLPEAARDAVQRWSNLFVGQEEWQLLVTLLNRQRFADINELLAMGRADNPEHLAELESVSGERWAKIFVALSVGGLMWQAHSAYFDLHPLFAPAVTAASGGGIDPERETRIARSFAFMMASIGFSIDEEFQAGTNRERNLHWATDQEHNLRHAYEVALRHGWWSLIEGCMQGLAVAYLQSGRRDEWAVLLERTAQLVTADDGRPAAGHQDLWVKTVLWLNDVLMARGDLQGARGGMERLVAYQRHRGDNAFKGKPLPKGTFSSDLAIALINLAAVERELGNPQCVEHLLEAQTLLAGGLLQAERAALAGVHFHLGLAFQNVEAIRDLDRAYTEYGLSLELQHPADRVNRAKCLSQQSEVMLAGTDGLRLTPVVSRVFEEVVRLTLAALQMFGLQAPDDVAILHERIARVGRMTGRWQTALEHDTAARALYEGAGDVGGQARTRLHVALDLQGLGRADDARVYARAADAVFATLGDAGKAGAAVSRRLLAELGEDPLASTGAGVSPRGVD